MPSNIALTVAFAMAFVALALAQVQILMLRADVRELRAEQERLLRDDRSQSSSSSSGRQCADGAAGVSAVNVAAFRQSQPRDSRGRFVKGSRQ